MTNQYQEELLFLVKRSINELVEPIIGPIDWRGLKFIENDKKDPKTQLYQARVIAGKFPLLATENTIAEVAQALISQHQRLSVGTQKHYLNGSYGI
jgi:hypothetical protein